MPAARKALIVAAYSSAMTLLTELFKACFLIFLFLALSLYLQIMSSPVALAGQSSELYSSTAQNHLPLTIKVDGNGYYLKEDEGWR